MIAEPMRLPLPPSRTLRRLQDAQRRIHERLFGEELTRINLDFNETERQTYLDWMRRHSRQHGIQPPLNYSVAWLAKVESKLAESES